ncbi:MAG: NBR1-Ig-like domain-containing protein [Omnitrophica WOR_2 bacterium]
MHLLIKAIRWIAALSSLSLITACSPVLVTTATLQPTSTQALATTEPPAATLAPEATEAPAEVPISTTVGISSTLSVTATLVSPTSVLTPTLSLSNQPAGAVEDKYLYVGQNIPDNTQVAPGATLNIIWTVKNVGKTEWNTSYVLRYFSGPKPAKTLYNFPRKIAPEQQLELNLSLVAPQVPGTYNTWWKLTNDKSQNFGDVNFVFIVTNSAATNTPAP